MLNLLDVLTKLYSHNVIYTELVKYISSIESLDFINLTFFFNSDNLSHKIASSSISWNGREAFEDLEHRAIMERRNISTYGLNLAKGEYEGDSARVECHPHTL